MKVKNGDRSYEVGSAVEVSPEYKLFICTEDQTGRQCLLRIGVAVENNGSLEREAFILKEMEQSAQQFEVEYERVKSSPEKRLNYNLWFPELVDSFVCHGQGGRRINILAFRKVDEVSRMVPLIGITERDHLRVDLRTSAWIMGKLLKFRTFTHCQGIAVPATGNNILIEPNEHYVLVFSWLDSRTYESAVPEVVRQKEISDSAKAVIVVLGGDPESGLIPNDGDPHLAEYAELLNRFAFGNYSNAEEAHGVFYDLVDKFWTGFYPFTTHPLT